MNIAPNLINLLVDVNELEEYPENVRQGDVGAIVTSLQENGQYRPIVVNKKTMQILAGNHTFQAVKHLGWEKIAVTFVDVDEDMAKRIVLIDNKANDLADYDYPALVNQLEELAGSEKGLVGTGFDLDELDDLNKMLENEKLKLDSTSVFADYISTLNTEQPEFLGQSETGETYYKLNYAVTKEQREIIMDAIKKAKEVFETTNSVNALVDLCGDWRNE
ncbi:MAG: hypothetical protein Unbinned1469contig1000_45 [Prokaryotic dsDNA virus sp.]|jgi:hypothetical protein|nr:MAG: hypothetical protein Unbinned1469contig1000_45 [Prokaryotic dsDNA virus sp.]|tara:strand:- start:1642 stop:2298 length:657 start_codon:yes stop_codon:yes gene_type:complete